MPNQHAELNPETVRLRLHLAIEKYTPMLPQLVDKAKKESRGMASIAISMLAPYLPQAQSLLQKAVDEATPEKLLEFVSFVEDVAEWLLEEELPYIPLNESY